MFTARAFWMMRRSDGLELGSEPPDLTVMVMSLAIRANCFAMRFHRANIVCLRTSNMRPMGLMVHQSSARGYARGWGGHCVVFPRKKGRHKGRPGEETGA